jgi:hypothetical protein
MRDNASVVASKLASGCKPELRTLLTHELPHVIVQELQRAGIEAWWVLYSPDEAARAKRVADRNVGIGVRSYMMHVLRELYLAPGRSDRLENEEDVVALANTLTAVRV